MSDQQDECCEVSKTRQGWNATKSYTVLLGSMQFKGFGVATSLISQEDADQKALDIAAQSAIYKRQCWTPPIGGDQLFERW